MHEKTVTYRCGCVPCGWQGQRTLHNMDRPCPHCGCRRVYPSNPRVLALLPARDRRSFHSTTSEDIDGCETEVELVSASVDLLT